MFLNIVLKTFEYIKWIQPCPHPRELYALVVHVGVTMYDFIVVNMICGFSVGRYIWVYATRGESSVCA